MTDDAPRNPRGTTPGRAGPLAYLAITASAVAVTLLVGGILFAFASSDVNNAASSDRFRLLAQAANPFVALLAVAASALVAHLRRVGGEPEQRLAGVALGTATTVSLVVVLLALNGVLTDLMGDAGTLFKLSAIVSRVGAVLLGALGLWLSITALPPPPARKADR